MAPDESDNDRMMEKRRYDFKRALEEIREIHGRGTELVSVYVPPDKQISDVANYLRGEYSQSQNIKSKRTNKAVTGAIESILAKLKYFKTPPANGVIFFVGEAPTAGDQTKQVSFVVEPPEPITTFMYRCDSEFYTEKLWDMLEVKQTFGLLVIDRSEATIGLLKGKRVIPVKNIQSLVPSKHGRGGQSALRFERLIEIAAHEFYKKVAETADDAFLAQGENLEGVLIGGPGPTKEFFVKEEYLHHELRKKIIDTFDTGYTDEYGLKELVEKAKDALTDLDLMREKQLVQKLLEEIRKSDDGLATYGEEQVRHALEIGAVDTLLISEGLRKKRVQLKCPQCGWEGKVTAVREEDAKCPKCPAASPEIVEVKDFVDDFYDEASKVGTKVELLSIDSEEGELLMKAFGGIAAILRYSIGGM
ncbi:peptide chain release factor aRF-1 [Methanomassiliicoccus luminyensis]|uniref:peptide chain release factor aRF-1 n=1 Tax=Methanomassiliicoccus luminyensis TaxID=1080712 RepID=UPI00036CA000|nr:peptide chain release factor aRF-1 [Methanomassiliicoccus luminyensis]